MSDAITALSPASTTTPVATTTKQRLFPLHLSPIEIYMLADDHPGHSMSFVVQVRLSGRIEREAFESALDVALDRHPLLRAHIASGKGDAPCWKLAAEARRKNRLGKRRDADEVSRRREFRLIPRDRSSGLGSSRDFRRAGAAAISSRLLRRHGRVSIFGRLTRLVRNANDRSWKTAVAGCCRCGPIANP